MAQKVKVAISYGFVGGPLHSRQFCKLMKARGYEVTQDFNQADVVVAHSAGCWLIPQNISPKLVFYAGMPLNQSKPIDTWFKTGRSGIKNGSTKTIAKTLTKKFLSGTRHLKRNVNIVRMAKKAQPVIFPGTEVVFIANKYDNWPRGEKMDKFLSEQDWTFINLEGGHDSIWEHPEAYIDIIDHYARLLA